MTRTRIWVLATSVAVVAVLAAGWFLLVSPKKAESADLRSQTESAEQKISALTSQLAELRAQQAELPAQEAKLAAIDRQIPSDPQLPVLVRSLTEAARATGCTLTTISPAAPVAVTSQSPGTAADAPAPPLTSIQLNLAVSGTYVEVEQFVLKLEQLQREFRVQTFSIVRETKDGGAGELVLSVTGQVFALTTPAPAPTAAPSPGSPAAPTPAPSTGATTAPSTTPSTMPTTTPGGSTAPAPTTTASR